MSDEQKPWWPEEVKAALEQVFGKGSVLSVPMSFAHSKNRATHAKAVELQLPSQVSAAEIYYLCRAIGLARQLPDVATTLAQFAEDYDTDPKSKNAFCDIIAEYGLKEPTQWAEAFHSLSRKVTLDSVPTVPAVDYDSVLRRDRLFLAFSPDAKTRGEQVRAFCAFCGHDKTAAHAQVLDKGNAKAEPLQPKKGWADLVLEHAMDVSERSR